MALRELDIALDEMSAALLHAKPGPSAGSSFPGGHSALALANHGLERALPGRGHEERARAHLELATRALARGVTSSALYQGFAGVAWVMEQIRGDGGEDLGADIDAALLEYLSPRRRWRETYDLIGGLVGYGVYGLERMKWPSARTLLESVVEHLASSAEAQSTGLSWRTRPSWLPPEQRSGFSVGLNLGVAHGVPGVVALLGRLHRQDVAPGTVARLLDGAVAWLLSQELPRSSPSAFAYNVRRGEPPVPARTAWCYGDPGVAAALSIAADASGERSWKRAAIRIGLRAAARAPSDTGVIDASLCHGASGLAHVFHRLHVTTGDARFRAAAESWLARTLAMRESGRGFGGFRVPLPSDPHGRPRRDATFLTGTPGIALALASFKTDAEDERWAPWDRALLVSDTPARPRRTHHPNGRQASV